MEKEKLVEFFEKIKTNKDLTTYNELKTKQVAITPLLQLLGWDRDNPKEVDFEHPIDKDYVDYALIHNNQCKIIIEAKKALAELENDERIKQVLKYCFGKPVGLAILTNGLKWWFYLPYLPNKSWEQRKFYAFDIKNEKSFENVAEKIIALLSKENVISDKHIENAENIYKKQEKISIIKETIPHVWFEMIKILDNELVELIANKVEDKCGYKPDNELIKEFLNNDSVNSIKKQFILRDIPIKEETKSEVNRVKKEPKFKSRYKLSFMHKNEIICQKEAIDTYEKFLSIIFECRKNEIHKLFNLNNDKKYFSNHQADLFRASRHPIAGTEIYFDTCISNAEKAKKMHDILTLFNFTKDEFDIYLEKINRWEGERNQ